MKLLVCGGRDFNDWAMLDYWLRKVHEKRPITLLIEGGAPGADSMARAWATKRGIRVETEHADWKKHGKAAGPIRNELMLTKWAPDGVVAFPGGKGTAGMIEKAEVAGVKVLRATTPTYSPAAA
jgi:hypothetical protein